MNIEKRIRSYILNEVDNNENLYGDLIIEMKDGTYQGKSFNELFLLDEEGNYYWLNDWYEGQENICLVRITPVDCIVSSKYYWKKFKNIKLNNEQISTVQRYMKFVSGKEFNSDTPIAVLKIQDVYRVLEELL